MSPAENVVTSDRTFTKGKLQNKEIGIAARVVLGSVIAGMLGVTGYQYGVTGGGIKVPEINTQGAASPTVSVIVADYYRIKVTGTGGFANDTTAYDAFCIDNPLGAISNTLSGAIIEAIAMADNNHNTSKLTVGFVEDCNDKTASGNHLFRRIFDGAGPYEWDSGSGALAMTGNTIVKWPPSSYSGSKLKGTWGGAGVTASGATARINLKVIELFEKRGN